MKKWWIVILLVGSLALNIGFVAPLAVRYFTPEPTIDFRACPMTSDYKHFYTYLGLNDEQLRRIEVFAHDFHIRIESLSLHIVDLRNQLIVEIEKEELDRKAIDNLHREIAAAQSKLQEVVVNHFIDMKSIMNEEQKKKFFTAFEKSFVKKDFTTIAE